MRQSHHIPDDTAAQRESLVNLALWSRDIWQKIKEVPSRTNIDEYLNHFVPSNESVPLAPCPPVGMSFSYIGEGGAEKLMYPPLVRALTRLVKNFPEEIRPNFHNYNHAEMKFPFNVHGKDEPATVVDVIATIPSLRLVAPLYRWRHVALVFQLKSRREDDPMLAETPTNWATLTQLAESARNIMLAQGRLYCFVVGIYGGKARIFRFDPAGAICSPAFEYRERPEILHKFLWRLFHPAVRDCTVVGQDPTVSLGTAEDRELAERLAKTCHSEWKHTPETRKAVRKFVMTDNDGKTTYLAYKLISVNPRLFSRSAVVWEAFKLDSKGKGTREERYIIKDTWRQLGRLDEAGFYEMLRDTDTKETVYGVAKYVVGRDYGGETSAAREEAAKLEQAGKGRRMVSHTGREVPALSAKQEERLVQDILAGHRTISAGHNRDMTLPPKQMLAQVHLYERSHVRTVLKSVGTPLSEFRDTKELATAFRDAIEGHRLASVKGVVHRDVSEGNVMICRDPGSPLKGFIHDFDHSFSWLRFLGNQGWVAELTAWEQYCAEHGHEPAGRHDEDVLNDSKSRTGTPLFMAVQVLEGDMTHEARHDLESFFWLLLFIVLRHTDHSFSSKPHAFRKIFGRVDDSFPELLVWKRDFLVFQDPVWIEGNEGLSYILREFRALCKSNFTAGNAPIPSPGMTHRDVLDIFNRAFTMQWPTANDGPRPLKLPGDVLYTADMREAMNEATPREDSIRTTSGDSVQPDGQRASSNLHPEAAPLLVDDDGRSQLPGTADNSEGDDANHAMMNFSDDKVPSDMEEGRPNAPDPPHMLSLLDVEPIPNVSAAPDHLPHIAGHRDEDAQQRASGLNPSRPTRRAKSPSKTKRAPARGRARAATRQVGEKWRAANVDRVDIGHRYNLRSLAHPNSNEESVQPRMTRSQTKAASLQRDAEVRNSNLGKRRRVTRDEAIEEGQSSKRQRTRLGKKK
ncbi:hypothetical protein FOMPIDRAFT_1046876 [Fomitopsis schrenkii]|uniref:Protein kinase domain-containing protein n=1 Tax=Fomitopsis schrenkii TaxID=2126942 RepID=S8FPX7_FOMSC|nr:hypothetical protein FOMPIDRAFT_1046876 [Fomitopsis schrenkii]